MADHSGFTLLGNIDGNSNAKKCENMLDPTNAQDYMTMNYYDTTFSEKVDDRVNTLIVDGEAFNSVYDDVANTLTCSCELATDTNKGVASFDLADFSVTSGAVALKAAVCMSVDGDSGTATPAVHNIDILGGEGINTIASSNDITISGEDASITNKGIASFSTSHFAFFTAGVASLNSTVVNAINNNTNARHTQNTDTALGSGAVAADHGTGTTDQIINVCYGTSATPPTASTTTEGTLYIQYTT